jgi:hypothetical protein
MKEIVDRLADEAMVPVPGRTGLHVRSFSLERYTELIVQECLDKISGLVIPEEAIQPVGSYEKWNIALGHAALEIKEHFGLKE